MLTWIAVLVGGALGSAARHGVNIVAPRLFGSATPYATAFVNMTGALAIGVLAGVMDAQRFSMTPVERALYLTGILGGFTTFSSFMLDSLALWQAGSTAKAVLNVVGQMVLGSILAYAGYRAGLR
jgi:fluoride exporter